MDTSRAYFLEAARANASPPQKSREAYEGFPSIDKIQTLFFSSRFVAQRRPRIGAAVGLDCISPATEMPKWCAAPGVVDGSHAIENHLFQGGGVIKHDTLCNCSAHG